MFPSKTHSVGDGAPTIPPAVSASQEAALPIAGRAASPDAGPLQGLRVRMSPADASSQLRQSLPSQASSGHAGLQVPAEPKAQRSDADVSLPALVHEASEKLLGPDQGRWLAELNDRKSELATLLRSHVDDGSAEQALQLGGRLAQSWWMSGHQREMHPLMKQVMTLLPHGSPDAQARALAGMGALEYALGNFDEARKLSEQSLPLLEKAGNLTQLAHTLDRTGMAARQQGRLDDAVQFHARALHLHRQNPDALALQALCLNNLGVVEFFRGVDLNAARHHHTAALELRQQSGDVRGIASSLNNLAQVDRFQGDLPAALAKMQEALGLRESIKDTWGVAGSNVNLAAVQAGLGHIAEAEEHLSKAVAGFRVVNDTKLGFCECLEAGADLAMAKGQHAQAVELLASAKLRRDEVGSPRSPLLKRAVDEHLQTLREVLGEPAFEAALFRATTGDVVLASIDGHLRRSSEA
jgi:tetratricopeptide (TPR) repeat protein